MSTGTGSLSQTSAVLERGIEQELHIGAQVYASVDGQVVADFALGEAAVGIAMTPGTLMVWLSSGKVITAIAIAQLVEAGKLELDAPIARYIPRFATHGKARITLRHVLTHTGGFRVARFKPYEDSWDQILDAICEVRPEPRWTAGQKAGYHAHTGWFVLGELIRRASGEGLSDYLRHQVLLPTGMTDSWVGMPHERYLAYGNRIGVMMDTSQSPAKPGGYHLPEQVERPRPSANAYGPIRELGRFYEMLLGGGEIDGRRVVSRELVERFTQRQRVGLFDHTFKRTIDWGLGFIVDSKYHGEGEPVPYGYGPHASKQTFGHSGFQSSTGFADPLHKLVVAVVCNGTPGEQAHRARMAEVLKAVYEDLGLAR